MEIIKNKISSSLEIINYFDNPNVCFLDIETTGLNRNKSIIYLIGVLYFDKFNDTWILNQYFANKPDKEKELLEDLLEHLSSFNMIITYNGESFDLPFIESRLKYHNIYYTFDKDKSFDIYRLIKKERYLLNLPNLKLKTIEKSLGINRDDIYSGKDCIGFYFDYINSGNEDLKAKILQHNYDDLVYMLDIIKILDIIEDKKSFILTDLESTFKFIIDDIKVSGDMIYISANTEERLKNNIKYYGNNIVISTEDYSRIDVSLEFKRGYVSEKEKCIFLDLSDFDYLNNIVDVSGYELPPNILVLMIEKDYIMDNIKNFLKEKIEYILLDKISI